MKNARKKALLVDGYNVIRAGGHYEHLLEQASDHTQDTFNAAREALLKDVLSFAGKDYATTVVFDGAGNPGSSGERQSFGTIEYLFSPSGVSADTIIEKLAAKAANEGFEVLVISSDANIQSTVFGHRVARMSAAGFYCELDSLSENLNEHTTQGGNNPTQKNTLAERIDPKVSEKLKRFVRGD
ncbi:MAG: NYN domain-containing protein [Coriobacteriia bacterium]|nr:NYN domain-containing protein [Coriobacteriia bacterium]MCL2750197.1 NYN domain-containing protein [Coriobacteriia bacterium]